MPNHSFAVIDWYLYQLYSAKGLVFPWNLTPPAAAVVNMEKFWDINWKQGGADLLSGTHWSRRIYLQLHIVTITAKLAICIWGQLQNWPTDKQWNLETAKRAKCSSTAACGTAVGGAPPSKKLVIFSLYGQSGSDKNEFYGVIKCARSCSVFKIFFRCF